MDLDNLKTGSASVNAFWLHLDRAAGALFNADAAALAGIVIELETLAWAYLDDCFVRADPVADVAFETVAA